MKKDTENPAAAPDEAPAYHADLDVLTAEAAGAEAETNTVDPQIAIDEAKQWAYIPFMLGGVLAGLFPKVQPIFSEDACNNWGTHAAAVAAKYGWGSAPVGCEMMLVVSTAAIGIPAYQIIKLELEAREREAMIEAGRLPPPRPAGNTAQIEPAANNEPPIASHVLPANIFAGGAR